MCSLAAGAKAPGGKESDIPGDQEKSIGPGVRTRESGMKWGRRPRRGQTRHGLVTRAGQEL